MKFKFCTCDVFTEVRFGGNPLAVVFGADDLSSEQMQKVAREFNLSETIFVQAPENAAHTARVRIFLPRREIPFAGHPTIGCACLLAWRARTSDADFKADITLEENAGLVPVQVACEHGRLSAQFVAPGAPEIVAGDLDLSLIARGLSLKPDEIGFENHDPQAIEANGGVILFVPVKNTASLSRIEVSQPVLIEAQAQAGARSTIVYTRDGVHEGTQYSMRNFSILAGIPEDPATGSAVALLPTQIGGFENLNDGTHKWCVEQGFDMGRPSRLFLEADRQDNGFSQTRVAGSIVFVSRGEIEI